VAHEFGNLLTHIIGNAEIALENGGGPAMKNALDVILKAADTAADILLRFRQLHGSAEAPAATAPVDLKQALEEALELLEFQFRKHHIQVFRSGDDKAEISGRRHSLVQVFVNLFVNSIYAMSDGGSLHVRTRVLDTGVEIHIRDSGPGIPPEILPRVTEPLFTTKGKDGSGLGLSICKEIIEIEHGGEFRVQNHSKGGVEIIIVLPGSEE
jgi:signal transduction histidine kinase